MFQPIAQVGNGDGGEAAEVADRREAPLLTVREQTLHFGGPKSRGPRHWHSLLGCVASL